MDTRSADAFASVVSNSSTIFAFAAAASGGIPCQLEHLLSRAPRSAAGSRRYFGSVFR